MKKKKEFTIFFFEKLPAPNIVDIYKDIIEKNKNLKKIKLHGKKGKYFISKTLFGYMLEKSSFKIPCKDINEAKYLKIFSEIGIKEIYIPEITTKEMVKELESKFLEVENKIHEIFPFSLKKRILKKHRNKIFKEIRNRVENLNHTYFQ